MVSRSAADMLVALEFQRRGQEMKAAAPLSAGPLSLVPSSSIPKINMSEPVPVVSKSAEPRLGPDYRPTPIAQAICMKSELPPDSTPVQVDQRIDRLLSENLALMSERADLRKNMTSVHERANECFEEARKAKRLVREWLRAMAIADAAPSVASVVLADTALQAIQQWAAKKL